LKVRKILCDSVIVILS